MQTTDSALALRERKKIKTRHAIRRETMIAEAIGRRIRCDAGDFELRADTIYRALDFVDAGMPLT